MKREAYFEALSDAIGAIHKLKKLDQSQRTYDEALSDMEHELDWGNYPQELSQFTTAGIRANHPGVDMNREAYFEAVQDAVEALHKIKNRDNHYWPELDVVVEQLEWELDNESVAIELRLFVEEGSDVNT